MKQFFLRLMALLGLAPARRYNSLVRAADELRASAQSWKQRATDATARAASLKTELRRQARLAKDAQVALHRRQHHDGELEKVREQLARTERELLLAREHLMAIEVKLDILEGAANVLDARTRTPPAGQRG